MNYRHCERYLGPLGTKGGRGETKGTLSSVRKPMWTFQPIRNPPSPKSDPGNRLPLLYYNVKQLCERGRTASSRSLVLPDCPAVVLG